MSSRAAAKRDDDLRERSLAHARNLVQQLESDNSEEADRIINELSSIRDNDIYQKIGKLTRDLHEKINSFINDTSWHVSMQEDISDTKDRLDYVIKLTEKSAHKTIASIEHSMPLVDGMGERAQELVDQWQDLKQKEESKEDTHVLSNDTNEFMLRVIEQTKITHGDLSDILMAQSYQDITGQVIQTIMNMVHELEKNLLAIMQTSSMGVDVVSQKNIKKNSHGNGPAIPGAQKKDVLNSQDDVDDLLSTLGF